MTRFLGVIEETTDTGINGRKYYLPILGTITTEEVAVEVPKEFYQWTDISDTYTFYTLSDTLTPGIDIYDSDGNLIPSYAIDSVDEEYAYLTVTDEEGITSEPYTVELNTGVLTEIYITETETVTKDTRQRYVKSSVGKYIIDIMEQLNSCYDYSDGVVTLTQEFKDCVNADPQVDFIVNNNTWWRAYDPLPNPHRPTVASTLNVTSCYQTFYDYKICKSLDLSLWDTSSVKTMYYMFYNCNNLTDLDISSFDTGSVTSLSQMFRNCTNIQEIDITNFNTANVTDVHNMFYACSSLSYLDLSNFDTSKIDNTNYMFYYCSKLTADITIKNNTSTYINMFSEAATEDNTQITVYYSSEDYYDTAKSMVDTKSYISNVILGSEI